MLRKLVERFALVPEGFIVLIAMLLVGLLFGQADASQVTSRDPLGKSNPDGSTTFTYTVTAEEGEEDIVIFDVSFRIPGSPGTFATPYSRYLYGETMSMGERIGMEIKQAVQENRLEEVVT